MPLEKSLERGDSSNYLTCCCWPLCCCSSDSALLWSRNNLAKKNKICYLERLQSGLFLLQSLLLLLLIHAAEGHAGGGERRDGVRQGGCSANIRERGENRGGVQFFFLREYSRGGTVKFHMMEMQMTQTRERLMPLTNYNVSTWCLHSAPWSSCPPERQGAAPKPPAGCWEPESRVWGEKRRKFSHPLNLFLSHAKKTKTPTYTYSNRHKQHPELVGLTGR